MKAIFVELPPFQRMRDYFDQASLRALQNMLIAGLWLRGRAFVHRRFNGLLRQYR